MLSNNSNGARQRAAIDTAKVRYLRSVGRRSRDKRTRTVGAVRVAEVQWLMGHRFSEHNYQITDDKRGREHLRVLLHSKAAITSPGRREPLLLKAVGLWAPFMEEEERSTLDMSTAPIVQSPRLSRS